MTGNTEILRRIVYAAVFATTWAASTAGAQLLSGYADLNYGQSTSRTADNAAGVTKTSSETFVQRYNFSYNAKLYPYLGLKFGYLYEQLLSGSETDGTQSKMTATKLNPSIDLGLYNPLFSAGVGFRRQEQRQSEGHTLFEGLGARSQGQDQNPALFRDSYNANFGLKRQEGRPTLDVSYSRQYTYDADRATQDLVSDTSSASTRYIPMKDLELRYQIGYNETENRLTDFKTAALGNTLRVSYTTEFLDRRVSLYTSYNAALSRSESSFSGASGTGVVTFPVTPMQGISGEGPFGSVGTQSTPLFERMVYKPPLIDTDFSSATDINIGYTPLNQDQRSMGIVFSKAEEMNLLYVYVNQDLTLNQDPPFRIPDMFLWEVYISSDPGPVDSGPKQWIRWQQPVTAVFNALDRRFEISFPMVQTQFIKVITSPLPAALVPPAALPVDINNILVTEIQAVRQVPVSGQDARERIDRTFSQVYDLNVRTQLMKTPVLLHHDFFYMLAYSDSGPSRYSVANALTASRRFSSVFSGSARVSRDDSSERQGHRTVNSASVSVTATPLRTLAHSLVVSAQQETAGNTRTSGQSAFLSNVAELYRGVTLNVGGGTSASSTSEGIETKSSVFNAGSTIIPHRLVVINLNHSDTASRQSGAVGETSSRQSTNGGSVSYSPYPALYLAGSVAVTSPRGGQRSAIQNYSVSWSPFAGGNLQVSFGYSEQIQTPSDEKTMSTGPSLQWRVNPRLIVNASYLKMKNESPQATARSDSYSAGVRWLF